MHREGSISPRQAALLNDPRRLDTQVSREELARLLDLRGGEDLLDLGSGTGFYTDVVAALTTGTVYAVELQPEMNQYYESRGLPVNVRLVLGDITALELEPASVDVAYSIATWHEVGERLDLLGLARILRPQGRLIVIDWRRDPESFEDGPPERVRSTKEEAVQALEPHFEGIGAQNVGRFMFAVQARRGKG